MNNQECPKCKGYAWETIPGVNEFECIDCKYTWQERIMVAKNANEVNQYIICNLYGWIYQGDIDYLRKLWKQDNLVSIHIIGGGMAIRNFLRDCPDYINSDSHWLNDNWMPIIDRMFTEESKGFFKIERDLVFYKGVLCTLSTNCSTIKASHSISGSLKIWISGFVNTLLIKMRLRPKSIELDDQ